MREAYPATFRLVGVSKRLDALARSAATEAVLLDKAEAPQREAARLVADAERRRAADEKTRTTNKGRVSAMSERDTETERQARIDAMIAEFQAARQRRLVKRGIALWKRAEATQLAMAHAPPPPEKIH